MLGEVDGQITIVECRSWSCDGCSPRRSSEVSARNRNGDRKNLRASNDRDDLWRNSIRSDVQFIRVPLLVEIKIVSSPSRWTITCF
jgi:C4-type Zn-finger protein